MLLYNIDDLSLICRCSGFVAAAWNIDVSSLKAMENVSTVFSYISLQEIIFIHLSVTQTHLYGY